MSAFVFDPFDFAVHADPYPFYATLRRDHPAYWSQGAQCWVLSRHADVVAAMQQPLLYSSIAGNVINDSKEKLGRTVGSVDPPRHTRLRGLVNEAFNRKQVTGEAERIAAEIARLLHALPPGGFDLVRALTSPLSGAVMAGLLGMDGVDHAGFKRLLDISLYRDPATRERTPQGVAAQADLLALVAAGVAHKRGRPGPDLISHLLAAETQGDRLDPEEVVWMARAVLGAGFESLSSFLANGTLALLAHPHQARRLAAEPTLIDGALEEMLRYDGPAQRFARILTQDVTLHGQTMRAGQKVMVLYGSANRDEAVFPDPDRFDVARKPGRHLGLGHGIHFCAGAVLARLVGRLFFPALAARLPGLHRSGPVEWVHSPTFRSLVALPVTS